MKKGYSLIELLIVLAIVATLTSIVTIRFLQINQKTAVKNATIQLAQIIKDIRSRTLSGQVYSNTTDSNWGLYIDTTTTDLVVFADADGDGVYTSADDSTIVHLDGAVRINRCSINGSVLTTCGVMFTAPGPVASFFTGGTAPASPLVTMQIDIHSRANTAVQEYVTITAPDGLTVTSVAP